MPVSRTRKRPKSRKKQRHDPRSSWSATRAARAAVRSRGDLANWFDTSPEAHEPSRKMMEYQLGETLTQWYPNDPEMLAGVAANDFDLSIPSSSAEEARGGFVKAWADRRRQQLEHVPLYVLSPEMLPVVIAAAQSLTLQDAQAIHDPAEKREGFLLLPNDIIITANPLTDTIEHLSALAWFPSRVAERDAEGEVVLPPKMVPTTRMMAFSRIHPDRPTEATQRTWDLARHTGAIIPELVMAGESWFSTWKPEAEEWDQSLKEAAISNPHYDDPGEHEVGMVVHDADISFVVRFMTAFWRLCDQQVAVVSSQKTEPSSKRAAASRHWPDVNVVTLRRAKQVKREDHQPRDVDWQHRWVVQMHRRWQWYPSKGRHELIFVGPYVKGPQDKPLRPTTEQVRSLSR